MRTFTRGTGPDRKAVRVEINGRRMTVSQKNGDGVVKRNEKELKDEVEARTAYDLMIRELESRGFVEQATVVPAKARSSAPAAKVAASTPKAAAPTAKPKAAPKPAPTARPAWMDDEEDDGTVNYGLAADDEPADDEPAVDAAPLLPRLAAAPAAATSAEGTPKKKSSGKKKKKKKGGGTGDELDKRVIGAVAAVGVVLLGLGTYMAYDIFLKPASIVGIWVGSRVEFETGGPMSFAQYRLVLDDKRRAEMTIQEEITSKGTYALKGNRLTLKLKDEDGDDTELSYKVSLGSATLDLFDDSGRKVVQLIRSMDKPAVGKAAPAPDAPKDIAGPAGADKPADQAADARLASVEFAPKDTAFRMRHPAGWEVETGSRPDNTYSWGRFTKGSAKIQVFADVTGSLMAGASNVQHEEGSELAPVHSAHMLYKKTISEEYSDYKESNPTLFKGSTLGEGRVAAFTASDGGLFGGKIRGYRVTLLTGNRRITVLCESPEGEFEKLKPTFLAVARSLSY